MNLTIEQICLIAVATTFVSAMIAPLEDMVGGFLFGVIGAAAFMTALVTGFMIIWRFIA